MAVAKRDGYAIRCDYMSKGWTIRYIAQAKGWFNINPHTGSEYGFTPQKIDHESKWRVVG